MFIENKDFKNRWIDAAVALSSQEEGKATLSRVTLAKRLSAIFKDCDEEIVGFPTPMLMAYAYFQCFDAVENSSSTVQRRANRALLESHKAAFE